MDPCDKSSSHARYMATMYQRESACMRYVIPGFFFMYVRALGFGGFVKVSLRVVSPRVTTTQVRNEWEMRGMSQRVSAEQVGQVKSKLEKKKEVWFCKREKQNETTNNNKMELGSAKMGGGVDGGGGGGGGGGEKKKKSCI